MLNNEQQKEMMELLIKNEEKVSELYSLYAKVFSEQDMFWSKLSSEEEEIRLHV